MIRRKLAFVLLALMCGCILPENNPLPIITPSVITAQSTATAESKPGNTVIPEVTEIAGNTAIPPVHPTPYIAYRYILQPGSPKPTVNFPHPEAACDWMGVGGQVFDLLDNPVVDLQVRLTGSLNSEPVDMIALTGGALYLGPGGFEFKLSDHPVDSSGTLLITLYNTQGEAIADPEVITTYASCDQNFILVNFVQVSIMENGYQLFFPALEVGNNP